MSSKKEEIEEYSFKSYFIPFTTLKAIHWIAIIGFLVFANSLFNGFVGDDNGQIINNSAVHAITNIPAFFTISTFDLGNGVSGLYYKPLLLTVYSLIFASSGLNPFFYHFIQMLFHLANAVLVFVLFKKYITKEWAFFCSLLFLVHPINQDTVAYISNLQDTLFVFFGLMAMYVTTIDKIRYKFSIVFLLLLFSVLSKETGIMFFVIHLIYTYLFQKKHFKKSLFLSVLILLPYGIVHTLVVGTNFVTEHIYHIARLPFIDRVINIPQIIIYYLSTFLFPLHLAVNYDWVVTEVSFSAFYLPFFLVLLFFVFLIFAGTKIQNKHNNVRIYFFFLTWFILGLLPHLQLIPLDGTVSPRWFYLACIGLLGVCGILFQNISHKKVKSGAIVILILLTVVFSVRTIIRNNDFKDNVTLMCRDAQTSQNNFSLENSCAVSLLELGKLDEAQVHFEKSVALAPYYGTNAWGLGVVLGRKAELQKDSSLYKKSVTALKLSIQQTPLIPRGYESLGYLYAHYEDINTARNFLKRSLEKFPTNSMLWLNYGYLEYRAGKKEVALEAITNAYKLNPNDSFIADYYNKLSSDQPIEVNKIKLKSDK